MRKYFFACHLVFRPSRPLPKINPQYMLTLPVDQGLTFPTCNAFALDPHPGIVNIASSLVANVPVATSTAASRSDTSRPKNHPSETRYKRIHLVAAEIPLALIRTHPPFATHIWICAYGDHVNRNLIETLSSRKYHNLIP